MGAGAFSAVTEEEKREKALSGYSNSWVLFPAYLTVTCDLSAGKLRGLYDSYSAADGRLSLRPFDQDFREDEDRCGGECDSVFSYDLVLRSAF